VPIVRRVAGRVAARLPAHVEIADLVSFGVRGLIDAVDRFDPARGIRFESYAVTRIRWAILDDLRALDWVPRAVRAEARAINKATVDLSARWQRMPTDTELAAQLSMDAAQLGASLQRVAEANMAHLDQSWGLPHADGLRRTLLETLPDPSAVDPESSAGATELSERIARAMEHLPEAEQLVLGFRYHNELTNAVIGEILGLSESRIWQLHGKALKALQALLPDDRTPPLA
jgi:RNA polymerase sigma factor for flagellar operon FliA